MPTTLRRPQSPPSLAFRRPSSTIGSSISPSNVLISLEEISEFQAESCFSRVKAVHTERDPGKPVLVIGRRNQLRPYQLVKNLRRANASGFKNLEQTSSAAGAPFHKVRTERRTAAVKKRQKKGDEEDSEESGEAEPEDRREDDWAEEWKKTLPPAFSPPKKAPPALTKGATVTSAAKRLVGTKKADTKTPHYLTTTQGPIPILKPGSQTPKKDGGKKGKQPPAPTKKKTGPAKTKGASAIQFPAASGPPTPGTKRKPALLASPPKRPSPTCVWVDTTSYVDVNIQSSGSGDESLGESAGTRARATTSSASSKRAS